MKTNDREPTTKEKVLKLLKQNANDFVSGQQIADSLFITRAGIWKAIKSLRESGYNIESVTNRGYRLIETYDSIDCSILKRELDEFDLECLFFDEVDSTNERAKEFSGKSKDVLIVAGKQTSGRGRRGRSFYSPGGSGLYFSLLIHPKISFSDAKMLTCLTAEALVLAIKEVTGIDVSIKWLNDIFLNDKKIAGILTETFGSLEEEYPECVIIGVGINVFKPSEEIPKDIKNKMGFLLKSNADSANVMNEICIWTIRNIYGFLDDFESKTFIEGYRKHSNLIGKYVRISDSDHSAGRREYAFVKGIDDECRLIVEFEDGRITALRGCEVSVMKY